MTTTILLCEYGSTAHGTNTPDSDRDHMGIYIEPVAAVLGLDHEDTRHNSTAAKGARSDQGDQRRDVVSRLERHVLPGRHVVQRRQFRGAGDAPRSNQGDSWAEVPQ